MGGCFSKKIPPLDIETNVNGNKCGGDCDCENECPSSCCMLTSSSFGNESQKSSRNFKN